MFLSSMLGSNPLGEFAYTMWLWLLNLVDYIIPLSFLPDFIDGGAFD